MADKPVIYSKLIIYYFSGTGNARNAAKWVMKVAEEKGLETQLINIDRIEKVNAPVLKAKTLIGFCSPTHGFNVPPIVLKFIRKFPRVKDADAFILNTRGGLKLNKLFLPGLSGTAQLLPALLLRLKGFRIVGMQPLDLPSNWIILHPGLRKKVVNSIYSRCNHIVNEFAVSILSGKRNYKALLSLPLDIAIIPVTLGYYFFGRFFLAKTLIATDACNACEKCAQQCPVNAITMVNEKPFWSYKCEGCMRCINACSQRAIETMHTFTALIILAVSFVVSPLLIATLKYLGIYEFLNRSILFENIWFLIYTIILILIVFLCYRVLHYLMRFKLVNKIITYSSLSTYKFWRRYKTPRNYPSGS